MLSLSTGKGSFPSVLCLLKIVSLGVALLLSVAVASGQQLSLSDNGTYPAQLGRLTVQGSAAITGTGNSYVRFDLNSSLPAGTVDSSVGKATLTLFVSDLGSSGSLNVYRVTS